jgi:uncharacterized protein with PQ loop repeat
MNKFWRRKAVKNKYGVVIDDAMAIAAVIHPLTALPQVIMIYVTRNATGVSLATWLGFMAIGLVFLAYGVYHRLTLLIVNQVLWFMLDAAVVIGVLRFG